ncbi:MAG: phytochelatin synthase-like protein [Rhodocyclaceae bacterium]|nr:MAG: phytochelatin synthase-like protein [Rhodocyclaceae bacterium]
MSKPGRIASMLLMASLLSVTVLARADAALQIQPLVPFASTEGLERLARSTAKSDFAPLANQFEAQATIAFCGPTTAAIVLNTLRPSAIETPRD